jgi:tetratricopeptide (TPR) repeat protein
MGEAGLFVRRAIPGEYGVRRILAFLFLAACAALPQTTVPEAQQRLFDQGERALAEGRYAEAEAAYEKLRQLEPGMAEVYGRLGLIYYQRRKYAQAVPVLRQALKLKPSLPNTDVLLAMCLSELGKYDEALPGLERGFRRAADPALKRMTGLELQRTYTGLSRDAKAAEVALELSRLYPDDPEVLYQTGRIYGNYAYLSIVRLSQVAPNSVWAHQAAGEAYQSEGNHELAIHEYRQALAISPSHLGIHYRIGRSLLLQARKTTAPDQAVPEALQEFEQELRLDPSNANAAYELGEAYRKSGEFQKAQQYFESALKYYPDFEEAQLGLGRLLFALGKPDLALPHLQKAASLNAENEVTQYQLSQVLGALGRDEERRKALAEFRRLQGRKAEQGRDLLSPRDVTRQELDKNAEAR